jgi:hypothetical protein
MRCANIGVSSSWYGCRLIVFEVAPVRDRHISFVPDRSGREYLQTELIDSWLVFLGGAVEDTAKATEVDKKPCRDKFLSLYSCFGHQLFRISLSLLGGSESGGMRVKLR